MIYKKIEFTCGIDIDTAYKELQKSQNILYMGNLMGQKFIPMIPQMIYMLKSQVKIKRNGKKNEKKKDKNI